MFFIILIYMIFFRICFASPSQFDTDMQLNKNTNNTIGNEVYIPSEYNGFGSHNDTDINLDRAHDFDNEFFHDELNLAYNSQLAETPFGGIGIIHTEPPAVIRISSCRFYAPDKTYSRFTGAKSDNSIPDVRQVHDAPTMPRRPKPAITNIRVDESIWDIMIIDTYKLGYVVVAVNRKTKQVLVSNYFLFSAR